MFEELVRPQLLAKAAAFGQYGALMGGHFIGDDYLAAIKQAGNEHSYWMCHTGTRDVRRQARHAQQGQQAGEKFPETGARANFRLLQIHRHHARRAGEAVETFHASRWWFPADMTPASRICRSFRHFIRPIPAAIGKPVVQVEAGTWTMIAQMGGAAKVPGDGYTRDIIIQGTVDGEPVVTARYGGGADFSQMKKLAQAKGCGFDNQWMPRRNCSKC